MVGASAAEADTGNHHDDDDDDDDGDGLSLMPRLVGHGCSRQTPLQLEPVPENLGQLRRWPHLRYPIAERSGHGHAAAASSKL